MSNASGPSVSVAQFYAAQPYLDPVSILTIDSIITHDIWNTFYYSMTNPPIAHILKFQVICYTAYIHIPYGA